MISFGNDKDCLRPSVAALKDAIWAYSPPLFSQLTQSELSSKQWLWLLKCYYSVLLKWQWTVKILVRI